MSLEYFLYCRGKYEDMINYIKENNKNSVIPLKHVKYLKRLCDKKIEELCEHEFVNDLIDITPDISKHITYCRICQYTKRD